MKHLLLTTIAAVLLVGCADPEEEANKLFTEASLLVKKAEAAKEKDFFTAYKYRKKAIKLLERITMQYPESSLSVNISQGLIKVQGKSIEQLSNYLKPSNIPLNQAVDIGDIIVLGELLADGPNLKNKSSALYTAVGKSNEEIVELLIAKGADLNAKNWDGRTPLHNARTKEIAGLLIAKGADVNAKGEDGRTPLHTITKEIAGLLIAKGADVNAKDEDGRTPLHFKAAWGYKESVELLITKGADVNAKSTSGETPLHAAISYRNKETIEILLRNGARVNAVAKPRPPFTFLTSLGYGTPLDWHGWPAPSIVDLQTSGQTITEIANLLRKHGAKTGEELKAEGK